ncbi:MAG: endosialidase [Clostridiales bacterium]|nr:endosialidase [Clostridiales bacterium]MDY3746935.1 endosialidase [Lachnospiraceae bacterium]
MTEVVGLICTEKDGGLSFGNYKLDTKSKVSDFEHMGDSYKVKTFKEITKLERNDLFVYESVPGTVVLDFKARGDEVSFKVEGYEDTQITLGLEPGVEYKIMIDGIVSGMEKTNLGGKFVFSAELNDTPKEIKVCRFLNV